MFLHRVFTPGLSINSYLLGDEKTKKCIVIDPTRHVVPYIMQAQNNELEITGILETHVHADFVSGAKELKHQLNEKPLIYASGMGGKAWIPSYADVIVENGMKLHIGEIRLEAIHTPGHTPEHIMWICYDESRSSTTPWFAFTGDCLFVGGVGRPDLMGKEWTSQLIPALYSTLFETLKPLPDFLEILPSHGEGSICGKSLKSRATSTLGFERLFNPYLQHRSEKEWSLSLSQEKGVIPNYFHHLKQLNVKGPSLLNALKTEHWSSTSPISLEELFLIDVRHPELFAAAHVKNSLNIPFAHSFTEWAGLMLPTTDQPIGIIIEGNQIATEVTQALRLMGFDQDIWIISFSEDKAILPASLKSFPMLDWEELTELKPFLIDVRTTKEWSENHLEGWHHIELNHLIHSLDKLPRNQTLALLCRSGQRASLAASLLRKNGFPLVANVRGGIKTLKNVEFKKSCV